MGNPEPNPFSENKKKGRCRDSMEAVLTNGVDYVALVKEWILPSKLQKRWKINVLRTEILYWLMTTRISIFFYLYIKNDI